MTGQPREEGRGLVGPPPLPRPHSPSAFLPLIFCLPFVVGNTPPQKKEIVLDFGGGGGLDARSDFRGCRQSHYCSPSLAQGPRWCLPLAHFLQNPGWFVLPPSPALRERPRARTTAGVVAAAFGTLELAVGVLTSSQTTHHTWQLTRHHSGENRRPWGKDGQGGGGIFLGCRLLSRHVLIPPLAPLMPPSAPCFTRRGWHRNGTVVVVLLLVSSRRAHIQHPCQTNTGCCFCEVVEVCHCSRKGGRGGGARNVFERLYTGVKRI